MGHTTRLGNVVELYRLGETFRTADLLEQPLGGPFGVLGVQMKIDFHGFILLYSRLLHRVSPKMRTSCARDYCGMIKKRIDYG